MTIKEFIRRYFVRTSNITEEEYYKLLMEFYARKVDFIEAINPLRIKWEREFRAHHPETGDLIKGTFAWSCYTRFIAEKMNQIANRMNRKTKGNIRLYVEDDNGAIKIHGEPKYYPTLMPF